MVFLSCNKSKTNDVESKVPKESSVNDNVISKNVKPDAKTSIQKSEFDFNEIMNLENLEFNSSRDLKTLVQKTPLNNRSLNKDFQNSILASKKGEA